MNFKTTDYLNYEKQMPQEGQHILAQQCEGKILVYQAFRPSIAAHAIRHQSFGGSDYSYERMSWIKPNFLWMMYRGGWAAKAGQEKVLGIWISQKDFDIILENSCFTSFKQSAHQDESQWRATLDTHPVRLQWDPDHYPNGDKHVRKAIQLGLKGDLLRAFGKEMIEEIIDLTDFVTAQRAQAAHPPYDGLQVAEENLYLPSDKRLAQKIRLDTESKMTL